MTKCDYMATCYGEWDDSVSAFCGHPVGHAGEHGEWYGIG
jgi:hypothetical protein